MDFMQFAPCTARLLRNEFFQYWEQALKSHGGLEWLQVPLPLAPEQSCKAPKDIHTAFDPATEVVPRDCKRFQKVKTFAAADRNHGAVNLMWDVVEGKYVIGKLMPNSWIGSCHAEFVENHPGETEQPWRDIGCTKFLNDSGFPCGVTLLGVYRDDEVTEVMTTFATEGDLFMFTSDPEFPPPGPEREELVKPILRQLLCGVRQLHDLGIVHRDISMENVLLSNASQQDSWRVKIIDYAMSSVGRFVSGSRAKKLYRAPEAYQDIEYDGFAADNFSAGVLLWSVLFSDYPWLSTSPGADKCFEYYRKFGFEKYISKRQLRNSTMTISEVLSKPVQEVLEGLLQVDPSERLTLGEAAVRLDNQASLTCGSNMSKSVWDMEWMQ